MAKSRNSEVLKDFVAYCEANPTMRFWQALRNWSGVSMVRVARVNGPDIEDTFYWEGKSS